MGDLSAEPSMEDILSSIKRIIAEEGETATRAKRAAGRPAARAVAEPAHEVLELRDQIADAPPEAPVVKVVAPLAAVEMPADEPIVSPRAAEASRGALDALSRLMVKPEPTNDGTLEGLVREMLRPMLREWLDAHLPEIVETMVAREIDRISQGR
ncbi:MAG: DUF2497 domain-containing protein [Sphingomonas sp.]|uniref:DUF2497 domain-containing protein n=1 Tax=Sphingomonas sp. TaxID=28214 RepID=UPI0025DADB80|nr:DUF2497 domain-containing protein [Sphingomonas sp.]MBY0285465.1 DUF2497 domain-containing protein [Sphingomonas sp.]